MTGDETSATIDSLNERVSSQAAEIESLKERLAAALSHTTESDPRFISMGTKLQKKTEEAAGLHERLKNKESARLARGAPEAPGASEYRVTGDISAGSSRILPGMHLLQISPASRWGEP
eukprot:GHVU01086614.1.p2 GENE.GHVU01086614.1~~GHVU01086614.1.p2  ORF type:complete len:119 (+),score=15.30 GHVU01086614.1:217-573(+)